MNDFRPDHFLDVPTRSPKPRVKGLTHVIDKGMSLPEIEEVFWEDLMPECLWKFRVKDFGPLWVGIDSHGNSLFHDVQEEAQKRLEGLLAQL